MDEEFVSVVAKALELVRKRDRLKLGKHQLADLIVVRQQAQPSDPPVRLGRITQRIIGELLDSSMRPEGAQDLDRIDWRRYVLLQEYVFRGRTMGELMADLGIAQALFFDTKSKATEILANELWLAERRAAEELQQIPQNIRDPEFDFIPRVNRQSRDLVDLILDGVQTRPWVVSIRGFGGVGKTSLAIEAAWAAVKQGLFNRVVWVSITPDHVGSPNLLGSILDTVGKVLGTRRVLAVEEMEERRELVMGLLSETKCLVVIDSTERVPDPQHDQVMQLVRSLPLPTCVLIVSREMQRKTELETMIHLEGMQQDEALEFLGARAAEQSIELDDEEAQYLYEMTQGNPRAMLLSLGWMGKYGLPAEDVLLPEMPEMSQLLDHLLGRVYEKLDEDEERVLNVMPLFQEAMSWPPIAAASGLVEDSVRVKTALGNLYSRFLIDADTKERYSIAPLTQMFLQDRAMRPGARTAGKSAREFRSEAHGRLVDHWIREFEEASPYQRLELTRSHRQTIIDDLRWCLDNGYHQQLTDLVFLIGAALGELGYWRHKSEWGGSAVEAAQMVGDRRRAVWHRIYDVAWTHMQRGNLARAADLTQDALAEAETLSYARAQCIGLRNLGVIAMHEQDHDTALRQLEQSVHIAEGENLLACLALSKAALGEVTLRLARPQEALAHFHEALAVYEDMGNPSWQSITLSQIAIASVEHGDLDGATHALARAEALAKHIGEPSRARARALSARGVLRKARGAIEEGRVSLTQSRDMYDRLGQVIKVDEVQRLLDDLEQEPGSSNSSNAGDNI